MALFLCDYKKDGTYIAIGSVAPDQDNATCLLYRMGWRDYDLCFRTWQCSLKGG